MKVSGPGFTFGSSNRRRRSLAAGQGKSELRERHGLRADSSGDTQNPDRAA